MYHGLRKAANILEGFIEGEDGTTLFGLRSYGVQIESVVFVTECVGNPHLLYSTRNWFYSQTL